MSRPMPGPPVCCCPESPYECPQSRGNQLGMLNMRCPVCELHNGDRNDRARLTAAECAAEFFQALAGAYFVAYAPARDLGIDVPADGQLYEVIRPDPEPAWREADTWHRFATHPHALRETP